MPYCTLSEDTVVEHAKLIFQKNGAMREREDLRDLYRQMMSWNRKSLHGVYDRKACVAKFAFKARIIGHGNGVNGKNESSAIEQAVNFTVLACNDELFVIANNEKYLYCSEAGADVVEGEAAKAIGTQAAFRIYAPRMEARGYAMESCIIDEWEYQCRGVEEYTRYELAYNHDGGEGTLLMVGYGNKVVLCSNPYGILPVSAPEEAAIKKDLATKVVAVTGLAVGALLLIIGIVLAVTSI